MTREAELELEIARLREALKAISIGVIKPPLMSEQGQQMMQWQDSSDKALSTPPSTTALQELIEKVERRTIERCAQICEETDNDPHVVLHVGIVCAEAIRSLK